MDREQRLRRREEARRRTQRQRRLPQKLLVVHRFTPYMIRSEGAKYREFTRDRRAARVRSNGFKLFYKEDTNLMSPRRVLRLKPVPDLVVYE